GSRLAGAYAWRTLLQSGAHLAFGSDAPVEAENPWLGIYAAVTRQDSDGKPKGGWRASERLSVHEALLAFTRGAAYAIHDDLAGSIRVGAPADLTVIDRDPYALVPAELKDVRTLRTFVAGREVFRAAP